MVWPADEGRDADSAFPAVAFDTREGSVRSEELWGEREVPSRVFRVEKVGGGFWAVVGCEYDQCFLIDMKVFQELNDIADGVIESAHAGGVALVDCRPIGVRAVGVSVGVNFPCGRVDHVPGFAEPLESSMEPAAFWIGASG